MKYKSLSRVSLKMGFIVDLPDNKLGVIEFPINLRMMFQDFEGKIKNAIYAKYGFEPTLEDAGPVAIIVDSGKVNDPFNNTNISLEEFAQRIVQLELA